MTHDRRGSAPARTVTAGRRRQEEPHLQASERSGTKRTSASEGPRAATHGQRRACRPLVSARTIRADNTAGCPLFPTFPQPLTVDCAAVSGRELHESSHGQHAIRTLATPQPFISGERFTTRCRDQVARAATSVELRKKHAVRILCPPRPFVSSLSRLRDERLLERGTGAV
ncbi:hypothetical protein MTO96_013294 [Rhipicephalus appendiculatus]